jgi:hypothetical protein
VYNDDSDPDLNLGTTKEGNEFYMSEGERKLHMHVIGNSGTGKTKFLEHSIRQDIAEGRGVCVLDPTGNLYNDLVRWCETHYLHEEREIIIIDPTEDDWVFGFNPLLFQSVGNAIVDDDCLGFVADTTCDAIRRALGESTNAFLPLLERLLNMVVYTLAEHNLSLTDAQLVLHPNPEDPVRRYLTTTLRNETVRNDWRGYLAMKPFEFETTFESVRNRLYKFLVRKRLSFMLSQKKSIDFRRAMDTSQVILVNLSTGGMRMPKKVGNILGSLIVNACALAARSRSDIREEERRPFYLYIDECHRYLNDDIAEILDELRQYRLHMILSHQIFKQLREEGSPRIAASIMANAATKVVFRCGGPEDNEAMATRIYRGTIDLEEPKRMFDKPTPTGTFRKETLHGRATSRSAGSPTETTTVVTDADGNVSGGSVTTNPGQYTDAMTESEHDTLVPEYATMPTASYSLQEQYERRAAAIATLPERHAVVKLPERAPCVIVVPTVEPGYANDKRVARFKEAVYRRHDFIVPRVEADVAGKISFETINQRALALKNTPGIMYDDEGNPIASDDLWQD